MLKALVLNALILINSRGAFVALIVSTVYYLYMCFKSVELRGKKFKILGGVAVGVVLLVCLADPLFWGRMATITDDSNQSEHARRRTFYWMRTFDVLKDHPFGVGAGGYEMLSPEFLDKDDLSIETGTRVVHSTYFQVLGDYGYHGFILFMIFLYSNFRYLEKLRKSLIQRQFYERCSMIIALKAGLVAFLVAAVFIDRLYAEVLYWLAAFIAIYGNINYKEIKRLEKNVDRKKELSGN